jgi:hypothetical protein
MSLIPFPDVPDVPGVPIIARYAGLAILPPSVYATIDGLNLPFLQPLVQWGVFSADGQSVVLTPDNIVAFDYVNDSRVSDFPTENGGFASYNKVATPFQCRVRMTVSGTEANRSAFISTLDGMLASTTLYSVLTPERVYLNVTLERYEFRRESRSGVSLITIDCSFREIRVTAVSTQTTVSVSAAAPVDNGQVSTSSTPTYISGLLGPTALL